MNFKYIFTVLFNVFCLYTLSGEFSTLANRDKSGVESEGECGCKDETTGIKTDDNCRLEWAEMLFEDIELLSDYCEGSDEQVESIGILKDGHTIEE